MTSAAHSTFTAAQSWQTDPMHPLSRIVSMYERAMSIAPYSEYNPEAADEIDDMVIQIDQQVERLDDLMWQRSGYLSDPDKN